MRRRRTPEVIAGRVASDGTIVTASFEYSVVHTATGKYMVTFPTDFRITGFSGVNAQGGAAYISYIPQPAPNMVEVWGLVAPATLTDIAFSFTAVGTQK